MITIFVIFINVRQLFFKINRMHIFFARTSYLTNIWGEIKKNHDMYIHIGLTSGTKTDFCLCDAVGKQEQQLL
jgi:hypothetical protein